MTIHAHFGCAYFIFHIFSFSSFKYSCAAPLSACAGSFMCGAKSGDNVAWAHKPGVPLAQFLAIVLQLPFSLQGSVEFLQPVGFKFLVTDLMSPL